MTNKMRAEELRLDAVEASIPLPGDTLLRDATVETTRGMTIDAPPAAVWPWVERLVASGDADNAVLSREPLRALVLGALYDVGKHGYLAFDAQRPADYWQATWALVLEPLDGGRSRLHVRSRVAATEAAKRWSAVWLHPFHDFMDPAELLDLKRHAERERQPAPSAVRSVFRRWIGERRGSVHRTA